MPAASCLNCGSPLPTKAPFCPECGARVRSEGPPAGYEEPPEETEPVSIEYRTTTPRLFGVTPPSAALALAAACLTLGIALLATGHAILGGALLGVALVLGLVFVEVARRLPEVAVVRWSRAGATAVRTRGAYAVETITVRSAARQELLRLRREHLELQAQRKESARALGEAVYVGDTAASAAAREHMAELDRSIAAKEGEMEQTAASAMERIQRAQLQTQPTLIETPEPVPEPYPSPNEPPVPTPSPEPLPAPSEPPGPVPVPEPGPEPSPPPQGE